MKKPVILVFIMVLLMFLVLGCGKRGYLEEQDFNLYDSEGNLYMDANDISGNAISLGENSQTFRGLKIGDTVTKVKELYGEEIIFYRLSGKVMDVSVNEFMDMDWGESYNLYFNKIYVDGKPYDFKQYYNFPEGTKYDLKSLTITIDGLSVSNITIDYFKEMIKE